MVFIVNDKIFCVLSLTAPIFVACKRRIFLAKIVRILPEGYSKRQIYLSFTIDTGMTKDRGGQKEIEERRKSYGKRKKENQEAGNSHWS